MLKKVYAQALVVSTFSFHGKDVDKLAGLGHFRAQEKMTMTPDSSPTTPPGLCSASRAWHPPI
jgi:hypothetical protein